MVGAEDRSCPPGMGTPGCQVLGPGLSTLLGSVPRPGEEFSELLTPTEMTRGEAVHNSLYVYRSSLVCIPSVQTKSTKKDS